MKTNQTPADRYTIAHVGGGLLAGFGGVAPFPALFGAILFELAEDEIIRRFTPFQDRGVEAKDNALLDLAAFSIAYFVARAR